MAQESRDSSPVAGEGRRLGDSSHNGSSSAFTADPGHRVGVGGSAMEEESQDRGLLADTGSPPRSMGPSTHDELPPYEDEGIVMDTPWETGWSFNRLPQSQRVPAPSEDGMFGDKGSSNDSTRVEGNGGSPVHSLLGEDDHDASNDPIYSEPIYSEEYGSRSMRESAPPPGFSGIGNDEEDDLPVVELQADPANNELAFNPVPR